MPPIKSLIGSLGNTGAVANARHAHEASRHEDELIAELSLKVGQRRPTPQPVAA